MPIIDLLSRSTTDWNEYTKDSSSNDSKVFVEGEILLDNDCPASLLLTAGNTYYSNGAPTVIPETGIVIPPNKAILIETKQQIACPFNMFGFVTGVGTNIFDSGFVSSGKIDSGFNGKLKIAYYNGNNKNIIFKEGDLIACCSFWTTEYCISAQLKDYHSNLVSKVAQLSLVNRFSAWFKHNWYSCLAVILSIVSIIINIIKK